LWKVVVTRGYHYIGARRRDRKNKMEEEKRDEKGFNAKRKWFYVALASAILLLLVSGFAFGYSYAIIKDNTCQFNPFLYGINKINELNDEDFNCKCVGVDGKRIFSFNSKEIKSENSYMNNNSYEKEIIKQMRSYFNSTHSDPQ